MALAVGIGSAHCDPVLVIRERAFSQEFRRRHLELFCGVANLANLLLASSDVDLLISFIHRIAPLIQMTTPSVYTFAGNGKTFVYIQRIA